jgi:glucose-1-phosphate adenylyltransferase
MDFNAMIQAHHDSGASISIATLPVDAKDAPEFGILKTDSNNFSNYFDFVDYA